MSLLGAERQGPSTEEQPEAAGEPGDRRACRPRAAHRPHCLYLALPSLTRQGPLPARSYRRAQPSPPTLHALCLRTSQFPSHPHHPVQTWPSPTGSWGHRAGFPHPPVPRPVPRVRAFASGCLRLVPHGLAKVLGEPGSGPEERHLDRHAEAAGRRQRHPEEL